MAHKVTISQVWHYVLLLYLPSLPLTPPTTAANSVCYMYCVCMYVLNLFCETNSICFINGERH